MKMSIVITVDTDNLGSYTDTYIAQLWHIAQANPAPNCDREAGAMAEAVGREIIKRFLHTTPPELYAHQGRDYYWKTLTQHGKWIDDQFTPNQPAATHAELVNGLRIAEGFIAGFEGDETQEGIGSMLTTIRTAIAKAGAA